jgi:hypothetical protein
MPTRIDIRFGGVEYALLKSTYEGLKIRDASDSERADVFARYGEHLDEYRVYVFGDVGTGFVVAGSCQWHEDDGWHNEPSWFGPFPSV